MSQTAVPKRARYRLYVDESGDHTRNLLDQPTHRYLALLGAWFRQADDYVAFADDLERFKRDVFGPRPDKPVILHRSEIINRKGPFGVLCKGDAQERFDAGLLEVISRAQFRMVCVVIDKKKHFEGYSNPFHPYHYCLAAMCSTATAAGSTTRTPSATSWPNRAAERRTCSSDKRTGASMKAGHCCSTANTTRRR